MSDFCHACQTWHLNGGGHYPLFDVRLDDGDDWIPLRALDAEQAAERFMEHCWTHRDGWEWIIPKSGEGEHTVTVRAVNGATTTIRVVAEMRPHYSCQEIGA